MGHRTVKRVPLGFDWPRHRAWKGYRLPRRLCAKSCPDCRDEFGDNTGLNRESSRIASYYYASHIDIWPLKVKMMWHDKITQDEVQALVEANRLWDFTREWIPGEGWKDKDPPYTPTAEEVNAWERDGFGHDAINRWILIEARCKRLGVWGLCPTCNGHGDLATDEQRQAAEDWEPVEPPVGEGWQLWETVSEGSPESPVFASAEELADWCVENATLFSTYGTDRATWLKLITGEEDMEVGSMFARHEDSHGVTFDAMANLPN